ncbi:MULTISPECIES: STAS domain-containing protein [unclassified Geodermatophilus]|uniref:STAS domain-containing protein n=1 Tax=unclassified Geodermatophilus TaxID=2637632 RepID=UPI003EEB4048
MLARSPGSSPDPLPRPLLVSVDLRAGRVSVTGELDRGSAHHLLDALAALSLTGLPAWTVDGAGITFCDATGLRALARARVLAAGRGRTLGVVGLRPFLAALVELAGLGSLLPGEPVRGGRTPSWRCGTTS